MKKNLIVCLILLMTIVSTAFAQGNTRVTSVYDGPSSLSRGERLIQTIDVPVDDNEHCYQADSSYAIYHNGLWWAWASPCDGGCSSPDPSRVPGWRYATESEWSSKPAVTDFGTAESFKCASSFFDIVYTHCDYGDALAGYVTSLPTGDNYESWFVHDDCNEPPQGDVPEFGILGLGALAVIAGAFILKRRK